MSLAAGLTDPIGQAAGGAPDIGFTVRAPAGHTGTLRGPAGRALAVEPAELGAAHNAFTVRQAAGGAEERGPLVDAVAFRALPLADRAARWAFAVAAREGVPALDARALGGHAIRALAFEATEGAATLGALTL